ncbi:MAG TPA: ABC transporter ATP-binding protein [Candidatus Sulfotelmatobacter sp.]|nr:ABC transporter ATP-binding protein [Candidatus Sulfotelmatobacter sp.]
MYRIDNLLEIRDLDVHYAGRGASHRILTGVTLEVRPGETVGIVGESGSGKSILAKTVMRLLPPGVEIGGGSVRYKGIELQSLGEREMRRYRGAQLTLMFQDPFTMLSPLLRCGFHITEGLRAGSGRLSRRAAWREAVARLAELGIKDPDVAYRYPFQLSGGMRQRVALAAALARDPELLIADEPSTALDVTTQAEILNLLQTIQRSRRMSVVLITHDLRVAFTICDRVYVLYAGAVLEVGSSAELDSEPLHPYTLGLLQSEPPVDRRLQVLRVIQGNVASPDEVVGKCRFSPRCRWVQPECLAIDPPLALIDGRQSACVRLNDIRSDLRRERALIEQRAAPLAIRTEEAIVSVVELTKIFPGRRGRSVTAVDKVSLSVGRGESVGLVGESGSGKTTIARCLVGLEKPSLGAIRIGGYNVFHESERSIDPRVRRIAQMVFQDPYSSLDPRQTVSAALSECLRLFGVRRSAINDRVAELLTQVGLPPEYAHRLPTTLSGGERQRVAIARALTSEPKVLVCDEPLSALDVSVQAQVLTLFRELRARLNLSYLFITHDLAVVRQIVERVYVLYRGQVVEEGPVDQVLDAPRHEYTKRLIASIPGGARGHDLNQEVRQIRG